LPRAARSRVAENRTCHEPATSDRSSVRRRGRRDAHVREVGLFVRVAHEPTAPRRSSPLHAVHETRVGGPISLMNSLAARPATSMRTFVQVSKASSSLDS